MKKLEEGAARALDLYIYRSRDSVNFLQPKFLKPCQPTNLSDKCIPQEFSPIHSPALQ
jgi:hypothetical protein